MFKFQGKKLWTEKLRGKKNSKCYCDFRNGYYCLLVCPELSPKYCRYRSKNSRYCSVIASYLPILFKSAQYMVLLLGVAVVTWWCPSGKWNLFKFQGKSCEPKSSEERNSKCYSDLNCLSGYYWKKKWWLFRNWLSVQSDWSFTMFI